LKKNRTFTDHAFYYHYIDCEEYFYELGTRELPVGLQIESNTEWSCLHQSFIQYLVESKVNYLSKLRSLMKYSLVPTEVTSLLL
jgi:hypothetical protein